VHVWAAIAATLVVVVGNMFCCRPWTCLKVAGQQLTQAAAQPLPQRQGRSFHSARTPVCWVAGSLPLPCTHQARTLTIAARFARSQTYRKGLTKVCHLPARWHYIAAPAFRLRHSQQLSSAGSKPLNPGAVYSCGLFRALSTPWRGTRPATSTRIHALPTTAA
jgi:hypothetical protein